MEGELMKEKKAKMTCEYEADRISTLPDELIHQILKSVDIKYAVETSVLSKRWKFVWTTLPFLTFDVFHSNKFMHHVLSHRNNQSQLLELAITSCRSQVFQEFLEYAVSHHVQYLCLCLAFCGNHEPCKLSMFSSDSIRGLALYPRCALDISDCWDLPALTTLHLLNTSSRYSEILEHCLACLPALTNLHLTCWNLRESPFHFNLPALTTLYLTKCKLPTKVWNFPALKSLMLYDVQFPDNISDIFATLVGLQNLTLHFYSVPVQEFFINCPQLVSLEIHTHSRNTLNRNIVVFSPQVTTFTSVGIFPITFGVSQLNNVYIKLRGWIDKCGTALDKLKAYYQQFTTMLHGLGNAKIVKLDMETIEALSFITDYLESFPSPFYGLKYVKIPQECKEESISTTLRNYLLGGSPAATIVTTLPQKTPIPHRETASMITQNVVLREPLAAPTKLLAGSEIMNETMCVDTLDMGVHQEHIVQNSVARDDRVKQFGAPAEGTGNVRGSSSRGNLDFSLWRGHEVNSEFICLLDLIMNKYPETFEHFPTKNKKVCTMKLNMLCTSVIDFTKISITDVDTEMIAEYRDVFASFQKFGFNVSWLVSRLNYVELLRLSQPLYPELHEIDRCIGAAKSKLQDLQISIDDTKSKLLDLQSLRSEKMQEIKKAFGTTGTKLVVGYIGDDLFSGP